MASDNLSTLPNHNEDDEKYGFQRPEMYKETLAGTVGAYDRHTNLTVCEGREGTDFSNGDVLIFPDMIKYRGLKDSEVDIFVEDVLVNCKSWASGLGEVLSGSHVFVCSHGSRDRRCGVCGPVLIEKLNEEIELRGLKDQVFVSPCSHVGGHKYAGNVIIYSPGPDGKIMGHWYGYVTPDDVPALLDQHIGKGEIIEHLWRGQMGAAAEEGGKVNDQKLPNGDVKKIKKKKREESNTESNKDNVAGCCQGVNGFTCCKDGRLEQNSVSEEKNLKETVAAHEKKGLGKLSCWMGSWEQSEVLTAVAVIGAVATVAVAYSVYRRSS
ncbi:Altered inheritance of mitochondria protein 32 [Morella rubra]|uniref:Altered inheritance of mitochondria protein 32 n=1 Tax=Morella rubra TaxID=262757 RepID=A0A6A1V8H8_9ROSI|nr:Altered inheritance of mitochondria protein 32 [Morella rubra]